MLKKFIGDRAFYKRVVAIVLPLILQNTVTNVVSLLDTIMVGSVGTEHMSAVAIANQLIFIFNLCIFGGMSGAGIFTAQFSGQRNHEGVRHTFRFKMYTAFAVLAVALTIFLTNGTNLLSSYITEGDGAGDLVKTLHYSENYLKIMLVGLPAFALTQVYSGTLRETGETKLPMFASIAAVLTNLVMNYILIFGKLGLPAMGCEGAAIATVISRFVELGIVVVVSHRHKSDYPFLIGVYRSLKIPVRLVKSIIIKGAPLLANEALWSTGVAMLNQNYSLRGPTIMAAMSISSTIVNIFNVVFMSMGNAIAIMVGQELGSGELKRARDVDNKLIFITVASCGVMGALLFLFSPIIPQFYQTTEEIRALATNFIRVSACFMPLFACCHASYFTLRSGGKSVITFIFDSGWMWVIVYPISYILVHFTTLSILPLYISIQCIDVFKATLGLTLVAKGIWVNNLVGERKEEALPEGK
ncbi:MAG: MATE family efflux transporter [Ruminococcaceae bacterium]|nr:MATE family efflux transporter [Oscillospiraceae bacterium]